MCGQTVVGFRDSASLYFPMFEAIDAAWAEGKVPLWNPFCNFGMPLVADGTSSVFYPCLLYTSPSPRDATLSRMPSSA